MLFWMGQWQNHWNRWYFLRIFFIDCYGCIVAGIKIFYFFFCDIAGADGPDASIRPQQGIPGLKAMEQCGLYVRMFIEIIINAIGKGI